MPYTLNDIELLIKKKIPHLSITTCHLIFEIAYNSPVASNENDLLPYRYHTIPSLGARIGLDHK
jgi:hypothetical protein